MNILHVSDKNTKFSGYVYEQFEISDHLNKMFFEGLFK